MNYKETANQIRKDVLRMIYSAQTSHVGSCFSCVDILTVLFDKADFSKDKLIVSKGWAAAVVYALAAHHGLIPKEDLDTYCKPGSRYIGLIEPLGFFGAEFAGGSMGLGLPAAVGFALSKKLKGEDGKIYCLMSDGEMQIGTTWESYLIAKQHQLNNLVVIIDGNKFQAMNRVQDVLSVPAYWDDVSIDGHDYEAIEDALWRNHWIYAHTIKGKGVSFMENNNLWHYANIKEEDYNLALKELNA